MTEEKEPVPTRIPTARQEIDEHLLTLAGEERKVRRQIVKLTGALAVSDQQLAGLVQLQADYRLMLTVLPEPARSLTADWVALPEQPPVYAPSPEDVTGHPV